LRIRDVARGAVRELRQSVFDPAPVLVRRHRSDGDVVMRIGWS
jgi:RecJ-like exonuclease